MYVCMNVWMNVQGDEERSFVGWIDVSESVFYKRI